MRIRTFIAPLVGLFYAPTALAAADKLVTDSVFYCNANAGSAVQVDSFDLTYHKANNSVVFAFSIAALQSGLTVDANLYVGAYGINVANQTLNLCDFFLGALCPLPLVNFSAIGTLQLPDSVTADIPDLAWTVPNLEAFARLQLRNVNNGTVQTCLQAALTNGLDAEQSAVKWATGIFTLVAVLIGLFHSIINSPSPAQYRWFDILLLFQTAAVTGMLNLNYPLVYRAFTKNFFWAVGMVRNGPMQASIDSMRYRTGGYLSGQAYSSVQFINRELSPYDAATAINLTGIASGGLPSSAVAKRSTELVTRAIVPTLNQNAATAQIADGVSIYTNSLTIAIANAFTTLFFICLIVTAIAIAIHIILFIVVLIVDRFDRPTWASRLRKMWWGFCAGNALRLCLMFFLPIWLFGFYQFRIGDSKLAIFFAALSLALTFIPLLVVVILSVIRARRISSTAPSISPLYTSFGWFHSVGALYRPYRQKFHYFWFIIVLMLIARAGFIAFGPSNGWAQVIGNVVIEFILFIALIACRPHKDKKGDWLAPTLSFFRLAAFGLLIAFIPSVNTSPIPRAIIGFVIIVMFGLPTVLLFFGLIFNAGYGYLWRRHASRIEDGLEIQRFVADGRGDAYDPDMYTSRARDRERDRESTRPIRHVDAANFVTGGAGYDRNNRYSNNGNNNGYNSQSRPDSALESRNNSGGSLARRTSIIEPVGNNVYEPSLTSRPSYTQRYSRGPGDGYGSNRNSRGDMDRYSRGAVSPRPNSLASPVEASEQGHGWGSGGYDGRTRGGERVI